MGANVFQVFVNGKTASSAFDDAVDDFGHAGYTGTIAEKSEFVKINLENTVKDAIKFYNGDDGDPPDEDMLRMLKSDNKSDQAMAASSYLIDVDDDRIHDKWGPAGCFQVEEDKFLFFGWASS